MKRGNPSRIATNDIAGLAVKAGDVVWQSHKHNFRAVPALADDVIPVRGIALHDASEGQQVSVVYEGQIIYDEPVLQPGQLYVVSDKEPGAIVPHSELKTGAWVHYVGLAIRPDVLDLQLKPVTVRLEEPVQRRAAPTPSKAKSTKQASKTKAPSANPDVADDDT